MKFNRTQAKALTTTKELELFDLARTPNLNKLAPKDLKNLIRRSRTMRDKLLDVKRKQIRSVQSASRSRGGPTPDRSRKRFELFADVHEVFVARLAKLEAIDAAKKIAAKSRKALASRARKPKSSPNTTPARSVKATTASKAATRPELGSGNTRTIAARKVDSARKTE